MEKTNLKIRCKNLPSGLFNKSLPFVLVYESNLKAQKLKYIGKSESLESLNPSFSKSLELCYIPSVPLTLRVDLMREDIADTHHEKSELVGYSIFDIDDLLHSETKKFILTPITKKTIKHSNIFSLICVSTEKTPKENDSELLFQLRGAHLKKKDLFGSDPYFEILRLINGAWSCVYRSNVIMKNLNPTWGKVKINSLDLCGNDYKAPLKLQCFDYNKHTKNTYIGEFQFSTDEIIAGGKFTLYSRRKGKKPQGHIHVDYFNKEKVYRLEDYLGAGLQLAAMIAKDFGRSGELKKSRLLWPIDEGEIALCSCVDAIKTINAETDFYLSGFNADVGLGEDTESFYLPIGEENAKKVESENISSLIKDAIPLTTPLNFRKLCGVLEIAKSLLKQRTKESLMQFYVLIVLISPGRLSDKRAFKEMLLSLSKEPISIIFVGVGKGSFQDLNFLRQGRQALETVDGRKCQRDCVDLIILGDILENYRNELIYAKLKGQISKKIKDQALEYFRLRKICPGDEIPVSLGVAIEDEVDYTRKGRKSALFGNCGSQNTDVDKETESHSEDFNLFRYPDLKFPDKGG